MFGLSVGNHSLTLLLALPVGLYVLAVEPGILRRPRFIAACTLVLVGTIVLVFLELPLRAGPFRSALVYGEPSTWDGFWYIVLAQQFQGSFVDPLADWAGRTAGLVERAIDQFGILAAFIPAGLVTAAFVKPRYALLTGTAMAITLFFDLNYENAEIWRYYLGPILIAWTWIAILVKALIDALLTVRQPALAEDPDAPPDAGPRLATGLAVVATVVLLIPTVFAIPYRHELVDASRETEARQWVTAALEAMDEDAVVVSWWSYSTPLWYAQRVEGQRPDIRIVDDRTRLDEDLGDIYDVIDANLPSRPVYVIRDDPLEIQALAERYELLPILGSTARQLMRVDRPAGRWRMTAIAADPTASPTAVPASAGAARVARLSYFFPAHNEEANLAGLIEEALEVLPTLADEFEIIAVNDGSRDRTREIADELTAAHPGIVRAVHHRTNLGYGAALRSGFRAARYDLVAFTDGDRQFRVEDVGRLTARLAAAGRSGRRRRLPDQAR